MRQLSRLLNDPLAQQYMREKDSFEGTNIRGSWMAGSGRKLEQNFEPYKGKHIGRNRFDFEKGIEVFEHISEYAGEPGFNHF